MGQPWRTYLTDAAQQRFGRTLLAVLGSLALVYGALMATLGPADRQSSAQWVLAAGVILIVVGCLPIRRMKILGHEIETVDPEDTSRYAEPVSEPNEDDAEARVDAKSPPPPVDPDSLTDATRFLAGDRAIRALLTPGDGPLAGCEMHLYMYDDVARLLLPVFEPDDLGSEGWRPGVGCVGTAYQDQQLIIALGDSASDDTFHLNDRQRERYRQLTGVAAVPVTNSEDEVIAILAASSTATDHQIGTPSAEDELLTLAQAVARILIDLLKWFPDPVDGR